MSSSFEGSCLCEGVKIHANSNPLTVVNCFCQHCNKGAGGPYQTIARFKAEDVVVTAKGGMITEYSIADTTSGRPKVKAFCSQCGCPLWTIPAAAKGKAILIRTALFNSGLELPPDDEIFIKNRPNWMEKIEGASQWIGLKH